MKYICPMGCEGSKTYPAPGKCPKCGMNLVAVKEKAKFALRSTLTPGTLPKR